MVKLASFWPRGWIEHSMLHPMVSLAFLSDALFNQKTGNVRGNCKRVVAINAEKIFFFFFFFFFVIKLASFWPHGWIEHSILHRMVPLAFQWVAWFNQRTGNVCGNCNTMVLINAKKIVFFIFFFFCCQAGLILTLWLNWAFNSASNDALGISVRRLVQRENRKCSWNFQVTTAVI